MSNPEALLPPGFRFHPTDEELILYYLRNQATSLPCPVSIIAEVDIYKFDPWELPAKAMFGDREWYFFSPRDRKYPNGVRPNRAAASGYWKATGTDKPIVTSGPGKENIGVKKALVFYKGKPPKGIKTKWIMHEYRLAETPDATHNRPIKNRDSMRLDDWVLCRIYKKSNNLPISSSDGDHEDTNSEVAYFPPGLGGGPPQNDVKLPKSSSWSQLFDDADYSVLSRLLSENPSDMVSPDQLGSHLGHANLNHLSLLHGGGNGAISFSPLQLVPMETPASVIGSCLKRQRTSADYADNRANPLHPHKKYNSTPCTNYTDLAPVDNSSPQCNVLGQPFLHQQMLLNSHLGLQ